MSALEGSGVGRLPDPAIAAPLSMLAFWAAIALPALYLPLLAAGIDTVSGLTVFLGLFALHVAALVGGRPYARQSDP